MKILQIIHNPTAGEASQGKKDLIDKVNNSEYIVNYQSTDEKGWKKFYRNTIDEILLAGGDGTIRKLARVLLDHNNTGKNIPIHLMPIGTANNIAKTLDIPEASENYTLKSAKSTLEFDCGRIRDLPGEDFFLESVGMGIFPKLMDEMEKAGNKDYVSSQTLKRTLEILLEIVESYQAGKATIKMDGIVVKGSFIMVELMNIQSIGPNIRLAPLTDPGDGYFDLVLIPEQKKKELIDYLVKLKNGKASNDDLMKFTQILRVKKVKMKWHGKMVHVDDNLVKKYSGKKFAVEVHPELLNFIKNS
jgi:diacylglycerol kinase (ATP)